MAEGLRDADRLAARLRLISAELHDEPAAVREAHVDAEVKRALEGRSHAERRAILEEIKPMFPRTWAEEGATGAVGMTHDTIDPEAALAALERDAESMSDSERQLVAARLARAGYIAMGGRVGWSAETEERLRQALRLRADDPLDPDHVASLAAMLADAMIKLDRAAWAAWQDIAPRSRVRQKARFSEQIVRFVGGDEDTPRVALESDLESTRMLAALLIGSTGRSGQAAWDHVRALLPEEIEQGSGARGKHRKLWAAYEECAATHLTSHALEGHMRSFIEKFVQEVMLGRTR